jgi:hypothetical protein
MMLLNEIAKERQACFHRARQVSTSALLLACRIRGVGCLKQVVEAELPG